MKYSIILLLAFILSSCCSSKNVVKDNSKEIAQITKDSLIEIKKDTTPIVPKSTQPRIISHHEVTEEIIEAFNHNAFNSLLQEHVSVEGNVDYKGIKNERFLLTNYISSLGENVPTSEWTKEDKLAYWINAYNAMTIDLILRHFPVNSIKDIKDPWKQRYWKLGDKWYNLDEIEHQIIRKMGEPRIHFALVCAAVSCPKLYNKAFTAKNLENDLTKLTKEFLTDTSKNTITPNEIKLSKIFSWFTKDFKQKGSIQW